MSVNLFNLLCDGDQPVSTSDLGRLKRFGGPILYLIVYGFVLFGILVWWDSGAVLPFKAWRSRKTLDNHTLEADAIPADVAAEANTVANSQDSLRVVNVTKVYGGNAVVDRVSFGVAQGDVLALLGPNGAGKTTVFNMIRTSKILQARRRLLTRFTRGRCCAYQRRYLCQRDLGCPTPSCRATLVGCLPSIHSN